MKKKSIKIIPIRNLMNNMNQNLFYNNTINTAFKNNSKRKFSNNDIIYKRKGSNTDNISSGKNSAKSVEKAYLANQINLLKNKNTHINMINNQNKNQNYISKNLNVDDKMKMKINGKLFMIKKHLGKYILEQ